VRTRLVGFAVAGALVLAPACGSSDKDEVADTGATEAPVPTQETTTTNKPTPTTKASPGTTRTRGPSGTAVGEELAQFASGASATSSFNPNPGDSWNASQAIGEPDTDECGDIGTAWASGPSATPSDTLTLTYDTPVVPTQIRIFETYNPGQIVRVEVSGPETGATAVFESDPVPEASEDCPRVFTIDVSGLDTPVDTVAITVNQSVVGSWNEIDAVELIGITA
jgi:hypothetical protein